MCTHHLQGMYAPEEQQREPANKHKGLINDSCWSIMTTRFVIETLMNINYQIAAAVKTMGLRVTLYKAVLKNNTFSHPATSPSLVLQIPIAVNSTSRPGMS